MSKRELDKDILPLATHHGMPYPSVVEERWEHDVRWETEGAEFAFGAEDHEPELAAAQYVACTADVVKVVAYEGEIEPPYQAHLYMRPNLANKDDVVFAGVIARPDRQPTLAEIGAALVEWRVRGGHRVPVFDVSWYVEES